MTTPSIDWKQRREELLGQSKPLSLPPKFKLPMLPVAVQKFSQESEKPEATTAQLGKILEADSGLTVEILSLVNSSGFGLRTKVGSVKQALNFLGIQRIKAFVLTTAVKRAMSTCSSKMINLQQFWAGNLERAIFASELARLMGADADMAFSGAMLQDFLLPVLTTAFFDDYTGFIDHQAAAPKLLTAYEQNQFGWDHAVAAAQVAHQWEFPDELVCCLYLHHQGLALLLNPEYTNTPALATALAGLIPDSMSQVPNGIDQLLKLESVWRRFQFQAVAERTEQIYQLMGGTQVHHISLRKRLEKKLASPEA